MIQDHKGLDLLHRADRDPFADQGCRRPMRDPSEVVQPDLAAPDGLGGEPINPAAWRWYYDNVGGGRCPIVDTFWQTETGGHMITPMPGATPLVPGSCTLPFPGIQFAVVDRTGTELPWGRAASWSSRSRGRR